MKLLLGVRETSYEEGREALAPPGAADGTPREDMMVTFKFLKVSGDMDQFLNLVRTYSTWRHNKTLEKSGRM